MGLCEACYRGHTDICGTGFHRYLWPTSVSYLACLCGASVKRATEGTQISTGRIPQIVCRPPSVSYLGCICVVSVAEGPQISTGRIPQIPCRPPSVSYLACLCVVSVAEGPQISTGRISQRVHRYLRDGI